MIVVGHFEKFLENYLLFFLLPKRFRKDLGSIGRKNKFGQRKIVKRLVCTFFFLKIFNKTNIVSKFGSKSVRIFFKTSEIVSNVEKVKISKFL